MNTHHSKENHPFSLKTVKDFETRLKAIYSEMDEQYNRVSNEYGFECRGCEDSCCETRFYHHTWIEYLYVITGFRALNEKRQQEIKEVATDVDEKHKVAGKEGKTVRVMCPLNKNGLCVLYEYRPMICRLHGISHELTKPGQNPFYGPGCDLFTKQCGNVPYVSFDRTPFYQKMAKLEQVFRQALGMNQKIKMTIAEMLVKEQ